MTAPRFQASSGLSCRSRGCNSLLTTFYSKINEIVLFLIVAGSSGLCQTGHALDLIWKGNVNDVWDKNNTPNWSPSTFVDGDNVIFDTNSTVGSFIININPAGGSHVGAVRVGDMTVSGTGDYTITGPIDSTTNGTLAKSGTGTLTLGAGHAMRFDAVTIAGGTVVANTGSLTTTYAGNPLGITLSGTGSVLRFSTGDAADEYYFNGDITGAGAVDKSGGGTMLLAGGNTYDGTTHVSGGTLIGNITSVAGGRDLTVDAGATYQTGNGDGLSPMGVLDADRTVASLNGAGTVDMRNKNLSVAGGDFSSGTLKDVNTLIKNGTGVFTVGAASIENLTLSAGTLKIAETKKLVVNGLTDIQTGTTLNVAALPALSTGSLNIAGNTTLDICGCSLNGTIITSANDISGAFARYLVGGVDVTGSTGLDRFINDVEVNYYTNAEGGARIEVASGGLVWNNTLSGAPNTAHGTFNIATTFEVIQVLANRTPGDFVPVGGWDGQTLIKLGAGALTLAAANTYSGGTQIGAGTLIAKNARALGTGAVTADAAATLVLDFNGALTNTLTGSGALAIANSAGAPANAVGIASANSGFSGQTTIDAGAALNLGNAGGVGSNAIINNGALNLSGFDNAVFANALSGAGRLGVNGNVTVAQANSGFTGATTISSGVLTLQNASALGSSNITDNGGLALNFTGTFANAIAGSGTLAVTGGAVTIARANTLAGATTINGGATLNMNNAQAVGNATGIVNSGTLNLGFSGAFANVLSGAGALNTAAGSDILVTGANNGFIGAVSIGNSGTLTLQNVNALGSGAGATVVNNGSLDFELASGGTFNRAIAGTGDVTVNVAGNGTLTLAGSNTYAGPTTIESGQLIADLSANHNLTVDANAAYRTRSQDENFASLNGGGAVNMRDIANVSRNLTVGGGDFSAGQLSGVDTLAKVGSGTFLVGSTTARSLALQAGTLNIVAGNRITLTGGAASQIADNSTLLIGNNLALTTDGSLGIGSGATLDVQGMVRSAGSTLIHADGGISGDFATYLIGGVDQTGSITLDIFINGAHIHKVSPNDIVIDSGSLVWNNTGSASAHGTFNVATAYTVDEFLENNGVTTAYYGGWDGKTLTKNGAGTLTLDYNNIYDGGTVINAGTVVAKQENALGTGAVTLASAATGLVLDFTGVLPATVGISGAGSLTIGNAEGATRSVTIQNANAAFTGATAIQSGATLNLNSVAGVGGGAIANHGALNFNNAGTGILGNSLSGAGSLGIGANSDVTINQANVGFTGATAIANTGALTLGNLQSIGVGAIANNGILNLNFAYDPTRINPLFANPLSGSGRLNVNADVTIANANASFSGPTTIAAGTTLTMANAQAVGTSAIDVGGELDLEFNGVFGNNIAGAGALGVAGDISIDRGDNTFSGAATVYSGYTLTLKNTNALGAAGQVTLEGTGADHGTLAFDLTGNGTFAPGITGGGGVTVRTTGTLTLSGTTDYTGPTHVVSGTLESNLETGGHHVLIVDAGAAYQAMSAPQVIGSLTGAGAVDMGGNDLTIGSGDFSAGNINAAGQFAKVNAAGVLTVGAVNAQILNLQQGTLNIARGKTIALAGTGSQIGANTVLGIGTGLSVEAEGTLAIDNSATLNITGTDTRYADNDPNLPITLVYAKGGISGTFGTVNVAGVNAINPVPSLDRFLEVVVDQAVLDPDRIQINYGLVWNKPDDAHGTFKIIAGETFTLVALLADKTPNSVLGNWDGETLHKVGDGTLILTAQNTYSGLSLISQGTLQIGDAVGGNARIAGAATVEGGATLSGYGSVGGPVIVRGGGTLSPGGSIGTLTLENGVIFESGSRYLYEIAPGAPAAHDLLAVSGGTVTIQSGATLDIALLYDGTPGGELQVIAANQGQFTGGTLFNLADTWSTEYSQEIRQDGYWLVYKRVAGLMTLADGPNMQEIADALDWAGANNIQFTGELLDALTGLQNAPDASEARRRLRELSPAVLAGGVEISPMAARQFSRSLDAMWRRKWLEDEAMANVSQTALASWRPLAERTRFWAEGTGAWSQYDSPNGDPGYQATEWSGTVAGYAAVGCSGVWNLGAALNVNNTKMNWDYSLGETRGNSFSGALLAGYDSGPWFATANLTWGTSDIESRRRLPLAGLSASADYRTHWYGGDVMAGHRVRAGDWSLTPAAGMRLYDFTSPSVKEKGADTAGLAMSRDHRTSIELLARLDVSRAWRFASGIVVRPHGFIGMGVELADQLASPGMNFIGAPIGMISFKGHSPRNARLSGQIGLGMDVRLNDRWQVYGEYIGEFNSRNQRHGGRIGAGLSF